MGPVFFAQTLEQMHRLGIDSEQMQGRHGIFVQIRAVLWGREFFSSLRTALKDRARLRIFTVFPCAGKIAELGITGQKFSGAHARRSPFSYVWAGDGIFFPVKDRPGLDGRGAQDSEGPVPGVHDPGVSSV